MNVAGWFVHYDFEVLARGDVQGEEEGSSARYQVVGGPKERDLES